jgi:polyphosphate kinase
MKMNAQQFINRELSWLEFNQRVLGEMTDSSLPLLERVKFAAITASNLDEFFMVRVGGLQILQQQQVTTTDAAGMTPKQQLEAIQLETRQMVDTLYRCFLDQVEPALAEARIRRLTPDQLSDTEQLNLKNFFLEELSAVISPLAIDPSVESPLTGNKILQLAVLLGDKERGDHSRLVFIPLARPVSRFTRIPSTEDHCFILAEDVVQMFVEHFFPGEQVIHSASFRILRNADIEAREDLAHDLLLQMEEMIDARKTAACVRLEVSSSASDVLLERLQDFFQVSEESTYRSPGPLDLSAWFSLGGLRGYEDLQYPSWPPQACPQIDPAKSMFEAIGHRDILLNHPFESFEPVVRLLEEAAEDPGVLAIKQTLYRTSDESPIVKALVKAAERGKYVTVIVELQARFDEARNIEWARDMERAGVQVIYGVKGLKTHAKVCMIVRREPQGIRRYLHFGTGNYNEQTARFYCDVSYFTCDEQLGTDMAGVFNAITGYTEPPTLHRLAMAPLTLRDRIMEEIEQETDAASRGEQAIIRAKMNSLVDPKIIKALYQASAAGVQVELNVRGICCLRPGVEGLSENIRVISIIDRYLEHGRIYYFHAGGEPHVYMASADWMPRNLNRRIELLIPVMDPGCQEKLVHALETCFSDDVKSHQLMPDGNYRRIATRDPDNPVRCQQVLYERAVEQVSLAEQSKPTRFEPHRRPDRS